MDAEYEDMLNFCVTCDDYWLEECEDAHHEQLITRADLRWVICRRCRGEGTLGGYPGVYTADDFAEDPDFAEEYMSYRRACEDCEGLGRVQELSEEAESRTPVAEWLRDMWDLRAIEAAERRAGA